MYILAKFNTFQGLENLFHNSLLFQYFHYRARTWSKQTRQTNQTRGFSLLFRYYLLLGLI